MVARVPLPQTVVLHLRTHGACALWLLALFAMAAVSGVHMRRGITGLRPAGVSPDATSEAIFASLTGERDVPRRLSEEFAALQADRPVLILRPVNDVLTALPAYLVAYQAMPRPALIREARLGDSAAVVEEMRKKFGAIVFVGQRPAKAFPPGRAFGRSFVLVPL